MAEQVSGGGKPRKRKNDDDFGMGHNLTEIKKKAGPAITEIVKKFDDMQSDMGTYKSEIKELYTTHSEKLGCRGKILRGLVHDILIERAKQAKLKEMEPSEREQLETLQAALDGTPFGAFILERAIPAAGK